MKSLFIYHWLFRILSPIFSGIAVYALILLTYGDLETSFESASTPELYLCIALALVVQELTIFLFRRLDKDLFIEIQPIRLLLSAGKVLLLGLLATSIALSFYYQFFLGYLPAQEELILFNTIYAILIILYVTIYLSHGIMNAMATQRVNSQLSIKKASQEDFNRFIQDINPELLTSSLESIIANLDVDEDKADSIVNLLSQVYRYLLSKRKQQLVSIDEEIDAAGKLISLYNHLPYRNAELRSQSIKGSIIPGTLIHLFEEIIKCAIPSDTNSLLINIYEENGFIYLSYKTSDKLNTLVCNTQLEIVRQQYRFYSERTLNIYTQDEKRNISIPIIVVSD